MACNQNCNQGRACDCVPNPRRRRRGQHGRRRGRHRVAAHLPVGGGLVGSRGLCESVMSAAREFVSIFRAYRRYHSTMYALKTAWRIAVRGWSF